MIAYSACEPAPYVYTGFASLAHRDEAPDFEY